MTLGLDVQDKIVPRRKPGARRSVVILGATGSIGTSTADIILQFERALSTLPRSPAAAIR